MTMLDYFMLAASVVSLLLAVATVVRLVRSHKAIAWRPLLARVPLNVLLIVTGAVFASLPLFVFMAWGGAGRSAWDFAPGVAFTAAFTLTLLLSARCVSHSTDNFKFMFRWDGPTDVSVHLKPRKRMFLPRRNGAQQMRVRAVRAGLKEIREALSMSAGLPPQVRTLTLASPWFGHGRHPVMLARFQGLLAEQFPGAHIAPVSGQEGTARAGFLMLMKVGRVWHRTAGGRGLEATGFTVRAWRP